MVAECRKVFSVPGTAGSASSSHISRSVLASGCVQVDAGGSGCVRRFVDAGVPGVFDVPAAEFFVDAGKASNSFVTSTR